MSQRRKRLEVTSPTGMGQEGNGSVAPLQFRNFTRAERDEIIAGFHEAGFRSTAKGLLILCLCYARSAQVRDAVLAALPALLVGKELESRP